MRRKEGNLDDLVLAARTAASHAPQNAKLSTATARRHSVGREERPPRLAVPASGLLFAGLTGKSKPEHNRRWMQVEMRKALRWACSELDIPYGRGVPGGLVSHDTRHTATSIMWQEGIDLATVMAITGHSARTMALHYAHAIHASKQKAVAALEEFGASAESGAVTDQRERSRKGIA